MGNLALIPARGGSQRISNKNIREFHGQPIIAYSIQAALQSKLFDKVIVSTDSEEIAEIARSYGAIVPFIRPASLSGSNMALEPVIEHALDFLSLQNESYKYLCTILATAPFLRTEFLREGLKKLCDSDAYMAFSVTSMPFPIQRTFKITNNGRCEMFWPENFNQRSQELEEAYQDAGQFYWRRLSAKLTDVPFGAQSIPVVIPRYLVQDIDTLEDWRRAEIMYEVINRV